jgi:serpin B
MWTCPKCGEKTENELDACPRCAERTVRDAQAPERWPGWRVAFVWGIVFEAGVVLLSFVLPRESWLFVKVFNFLQYSHFLFLLLFNTFEPSSTEGQILALVVMGVCMALVWAFVLVGGAALLRFVLEGLGLSGRRRRLFWWGAAALGVTALMWLVADRLGDRPVPFTPSPAVKTVVAGNTAMALDSYQKLRATPGNVFFSPFGISTGLGLVYAGARGGTESEIGRAAHFNLPQGELHPAFGELIARLGRLQHGSRLTLVMANGLWLQQGYTFSNAFLQLARTPYRTQLEAADFMQDRGTASSRMNAWVAKQTRGRIKGIVEARSFDLYTRLVLCDVLYFKGNWRSQFKENKTRSAPFHLSAKETAEVPMMSQEAEFKMAWDEGHLASLIELPYYGGDVSMVIILPEAVDGLAEIEDGLTADKLASWLARLDKANPCETWVHLPRFTTRQSVDLRPVLNSLGIVSAFTLGADFSGMDGTTNLFLGCALQRTFVEVNESGTEAAAATLFEARTAGMSNRFNADHPFLFLIRDRGSGMILFMGRLANPRS